MLYGLLLFQCSLTLIKTLFTKIYKLKHCNWEALHTDVIQQNEKLALRWSFTSFFLLLCCFSFVCYNQFIWKLLSYLPIVSLPHQFVSLHRNCVATEFSCLKRNIYFASTTYKVFNVLKLCCCKQIKAFFRQVCFSDIEYNFYSWLYKST